MITVTIEKYNKRWYVIVRMRGAQENLMLADFTTKKAAIHCRDTWAENFGYEIV